MSDFTDDVPMSERFASLAGNSADQAEKAARMAEMAYGGEDPRGCKRARREAKDAYEQTMMDVMRANGALAAESRVFDAKHPKAEEAAQRALAARDAAADSYRRLKASDAEADA